LEKDKLQEKGENVRRKKFRLIEDVNYPHSKIYAHSDLQYIEMPEGRQVLILKYNGSKILLEQDGKISYLYCYVEKTKIGNISLSALVYPEEIY
jgi:hypothetical protein